MSRMGAISVCSNLVSRALRDGPSSSAVRWKWAAKPERAAPVNCGLRMADCSQVSRTCMSGSGRSIGRVGQGDGADIAALCCNVWRCVGGSYTGTHMSSLIYSHGKRMTTMLHVMPNATDTTTRVVNATTARKGAPRRAGAVTVPATTMCSSAHAMAA